MFEGLESADKDPRKSLHVGEVAVPELAPDEAYVAVMASCHQLQHRVDLDLRAAAHLRLPRPAGQGERLGHAPRPRLPRGRLGRRRAWCCGPGSAVRNWKPGRQGHRPLQLRRRPGPERPRRLDAGRQPAHLGLRDQLRRPGRPGRRQGQPAHAQAAPPDLGGGGGQRAVQLHLLPHAGLAQRRPDDAGRQGPGLGGDAAGSAATPCSTCSTAAARRSAWSPRPTKVELLHELGVEAVIDRKAADYRFWTDEHTQDESEWRRLRQGHPGPGRRRRPTSSSSTRAARPWAPRSSRAKRGGTIVTCAATSGYMIEYDNRHLWMKLKTIKGSHFANYREAWDANQLVCEGKILPPLSAVLPPGRGGRGRVPGPPQPARGQDRRAVPGARGGPRHRRPRVPRPGRRGPDHPVPEARGMTELLLTEIDHVAIAVHDLEAAIAYYRETFGATVDHREVVESDGVEEALLKVADSYIQLLTPTAADSPVAKYLAKQGRGPPPRRLPGGRLRRGPPVGQGPRGPGHRRGPPARFAWDHRGVRPPQGGVRDADRARPGVSSGVDGQSHRGR